MPLEHTTAMVCSRASVVDISTAHAGAEGESGFTSLSEASSLSTHSNGMLRLIGPNSHLRLCSC